MSKIFDRLSITWQFSLLFVFALGLMASGTTTALWQTYQLQIAAKQAQIAAIDDSARSLTEHYVAEAQSGALTQAQAQAEALAALGAIRYAGSGYIYVFRDDGTVLAHPKKSWIGTNQMNFRDPNGTLVNGALIGNAVAGRTVFQHYVFAKSPGGPLAGKMSMAVAVPEWGWVLGTGLYMDDIDSNLSAAALILATVFLPLLGLYVLWVAAVQRHIGGLLKALSGAMLRLAEGELGIAIPAERRADELGQMARALGVFRGAERRKRELEAEAKATAAAVEEERSRATALRAHEEAERQAAMDQLGASLDQLARGNLLVQLPSGLADRYAKLRGDFNSAVGRLRETMQAVADNTSGVRTGAGEMMQAADDLARRTEEQAAALGETAATLDDVTGTVSRTAASAEEARKVAGETREEAERSGAVVRAAVGAMGEIEQSSRQIGNIIGVIDEIAFQTNLLALNAGVEAARAGDAGRGFAVVATEVRALAQRSADAAKEIKALVSTSGAQVASGVRLVGDAGGALTRIAGQVGQLNALIAEIAASAAGQAKGLAEVNSAVSRMDHATQQNAAMVEQATAASHALSHEAGGLETLVGRFVTGERQSRLRQPERVLSRVP